MNRSTLAGALALALLLPSVSLAQEGKPPAGKGEKPGAKDPHALPPGHPGVPHGAVPPGHPPFPAGVSPHDPVAMLKALGATPEQIQKVLEIHHQGMLRSVDLHAAIKKADLQLEFLHQKPDASAKEFMDAIDASSSAKANLMKAHVSLAFEVKAAVGDEMFAKLKKHLPLLHGGQGHPGMGGMDPHMGMGMGMNPHMGMGQNPHMGMGQNPHRGMGMKNPHGGMAKGGHAACKACVAGMCKACKLGKCPTCNGGCSSCDGQGCADCDEGHGARGRGRADRGRGFMGMLRKLRERMRGNRGDRGNRGRGRRSREY
ncbi:MAG: hypothetical protein R3F62_10905 [Planctomycetota bacterium]